MILRNTLIKAFKICHALLFGFLIQTNCYAQQSELIVLDTRTVNDLPGAFQTKVQFDFKDRSVIGVPGTGAYSGMMTMAPWGDASGGKNHQLNFNDGGIFYRAGAHNASSWEAWRKLIVEDEYGNVGIGTTTPAYKLDVKNNLRVGAQGGNDYTIIAGGDGVGSEIRMYYADGSENNHLAGNNNSWFAATTGNVGIGTRLPTEKLSVNGKIRAKEIKVEVANWPDYVFFRDYKLPTLKETEKHIKEKGHLPGIPSAEEVKTNGVDLGEMNVKLLQKIEELTLHLIEQNKLIQTQQEDIKNLKLKVETKFK